MKILYAVQGTGNGHLSRARELVPLLDAYGQVDVLVSGTHSEIAINRPVLYQFHGMGFQFGKKGGVDYWASAKDLRPFRFIRDLWDLPVNHYDLILNDFEPVSAYAAKRVGKQVHAISHQAAFLSNKSPRPTNVKAPFAEWLFRNYAPSQSQTAFHFQPYDDFIHTPVIRDEVRQLLTSQKGHITVYLPAYDDAILARHFKNIKAVEWHLFSKHQKKEVRYANLWVRPVNNTQFMESMAQSEGVLTGGGFESPAEALFLGKKLFAVPMSNQYEQQCNAAALALMGIPVADKIDGLFAKRLAAWLAEPAPIKVNYPDTSAAIIAQIFKNN
jgi:uncharacterized protein (TIGR00661 family)